MSTWLYCTISKGNGGHGSRATDGRKEKVGQNDKMALKKPANKKTGGSSKKTITNFHI